MLNRLNFFFTNDWLTLFDTNEDSEFTLVEVGWERCGVTDDIDINLGLLGFSVWISIDGKQSHSFDKNEILRKRIEDAIADDETYKTLPFKDYRSPYTDSVFADDNIKPHNSGSKLKAAIKGGADAITMPPPKDGRYPNGLTAKELGRELEDLDLDTDAADESGEIWVTTGLGVSSPVTSVRRLNKNDLLLSSNNWRDEEQS